MITLYVFFITLVVLYPLSIAPIFLILFFDGFHINIASVIEFKIY